MLPAAPVGAKNVHVPVPFTHIPAGTPPQLGSTTSAEGGFDAPCPTMTQEIWTDVRGRPYPRERGRASAVGRSRRPDRRAVEAPPAVDDRADRARGAARASRPRRRAAAAHRLTRELRARNPPAAGR